MKPFVMNDLVTSGDLPMRLVYAANGVVAGFVVLSFVIPFRHLFGS